MARIISGLKDEHPSLLDDMVDDAQGTTLSWLAEEETSFAAMQLLWQWIDRYRIPQSLYTNKKNVYVIYEKTREKAGYDLASILYRGRTTPTLDWVVRFANPSGATS